MDNRDWTDVLWEKIEQLPFVDDRGQHFARWEELSRARVLMLILATRCGPDSAGEDWLFRAAARLEARIDGMLERETHRPVGVLDTPWRFWWEKERSNV